MDALSPLLLPFQLAANCRPKAKRPKPKTPSTIQKRRFSPRHDYDKFPNEPNPISPQTAFLKASRKCGFYPVKALL
jgi:hypothetical protein